MVTQYCEFSILKAETKSFMQYVLSKYSTMQTWEAYMYLTTLILINLL